MKKIIKVAVIGCSSMAKLHMKGVVENENAELYAICGTDVENLELRAKEFGVEKTTTDYNELVSDPMVDAVVLVTPDQIHREMTEKFLKASKAVLCEKPMALTMEDCNAMIACERETGGKLMIGQICRANPRFALMKELVASGRIGELMFVESEYAHNYEKVAGFENWRKVPERQPFIGGGCHAVDLLRWIAGDPTEVTAYSNKKYLLDWPVDDNTVAIFKFPDNVIGKVFVSIGCKRNYTMRTCLYGTKGTLIYESGSPYVQLFETNDELGCRFSSAPQMLYAADKDHNAVKEIADFIDALVNEKNMPVSSVDGASTVAVCCAAVESAASGKPVSIKYPV